MTKKKEEEGCMLNTHEVRIGGVEEEKEEKKRKTMQKWEGVYTARLGRINTLGSLVSANLS